MYTGPHIKRDGLVFGYDTSYGIDTNSISSRFYPGEPTINYGENSMSVYGSYWTNIGREGNTHTIYRHAGASSSTIAMASSIFSGLPVGTVTTISGYLYKNGVPYNTTSDTISTYNTTISHETRDDGYFRYTQSLNYTNGSWNIHAVLISSPVEGDTIILKDLQMEVNTHSTPYLKYNTSRSSTASLIDLKKTTDIDVSNVSFDSTGQPVFDGTDDYINLNSVSPLIAGGDFSLESVIKGPTQDHKGIIPINTSSGGNRALFLIRSASMGIYDGGTWYIGNIDVDDDNWHHVTLSYTRSIKKAVIYVDGKVSLDVTTNNMITVATDDRISVGQEWDGDSTSDHFNGQIPVVKIYNRALSAEEVEQNFKAYKNRFDI